MEEILGGGVVGCPLRETDNVRSTGHVRLGKLVVLKAGGGDGREDARFGCGSHQII